MPQDIFIVYYVFINPSNDWKNIVIGQLQDIVSSKIMHTDAYNVNLDIVLSCHSADLIEVARRMIEEFFTRIAICNYTIVYATDNNFFEYPGIYQLYSRGCSNPDAICLYLHTKGMVFNRGCGRVLAEIRLTRNVLHSWEKTVGILNGCKDINKATIACSANGWGWFNFFWVKGSYLKECCKEPIKTSDRYYYESWVGRYGSNTYEDCYNIIDDEVKYYEPGDASMLLSRLNTYYFR